jgi:hypothetical protein
MQWYGEMILGHLSNNRAPGSFAIVLLDEAALEFGSEYILLLLDH